MKSIEQIIREHRYDVDLNKIKDDMPLTVIGLDSFDFVELAIYVENEYNVTFSDEELAECRTLKDLKNLLKKYLCIKLKLPN